MTYKVKTAIEALNSKAKFRIVNDSVDQIEWLEGTTPIDKDTITSKITEQQTAYNNDYKRKRQEAYPGVWDQLDMIYWDQVNGTAKFKEAIAKVKADNPKD
tara:strand:+ start:946 stop:1248 length:303 start_codon:yes stop_codon:yes gene_type:complete